MELTTKKGIDENIWFHLLCSSAEGRMRLSFTSRFPETTQSPKKKLFLITNIVLGLHWIESNKYFGGFAVCQCSTLRSTQNLPVVKIRHKGKKY